MPPCSNCCCSLHAWRKLGPAKKWWAKRTNQYGVLQIQEENQNVWDRCVTMGVDGVEQGQAFRTCHKKCREQPRRAVLNNAQHLQLVRPAINCGIIHALTITAARHLGDGGAPKVAPRAPREQAAV